MKTINKNKLKHRWIYLFLAILLVREMAIAQPVDYEINKNTKNKKAMTTTIHENKEIVRDLYEKVLNNRNLQLLREFVSEDYVAVSGKKGPAGFEETVNALIKSFPDAQWKVEELFGESDKVFVRWKFEGTHTGQFQQFAATGQKVSNDGMGIYELKDGKVKATRVYTDRLGFLQQLEILPVDLISLSNGETQKGQVRFIDKFLVPESAEQEFVNRMNINRDFISQLPGFIEDAVYKNSDQNGNLIYLTIAVWKSKDALKKAKKAVQAKYQKEGFNLAEMMERLNITMERGIYKEIESF